MTPLPKWCKTFQQIASEEECQLLSIIEIFLNSDWLIFSTISDILIIRKANINLEAKIK